MPVMFSRALVLTILFRMNDLVPATLSTSNSTTHPTVHIESTPRAASVVSDQEHVAHLDQSNDTSQTSNAKPLSVHWTYLDRLEDSELTASDWAKYYPKCSGHRQSPLWITTKNTIHDPTLHGLTLVDYDDAPVRDLWKVVNNGHAVQFSGYFRTPPQMQGGDLPGKYIFQQMHFHWGSNNSIGSEHKLDGQSFPLEAHLVHRRKNDTDEEADDDDVGMAVIGILFELTKLGEEPNKHMEDIIDAVRKVTIPGRAINATLPGFSLSNLMPTDPSFVRYLGSLTTPPCSEAVVWTVLTHPVKISAAQLDVFRSLMKALAAKASVAEPTARSGRELPRNGTSTEAAEKGLRLMDNFRTGQPAYERNVTFYNASVSGQKTILTLDTDDIPQNIPRMAIPAMRQPSLLTTTTQKSQGPAAISKDGKINNSVINVAGRRFHGEYILWIDVAILLLFCGF